MVLCYSHVENVEDTCQEQRAVFSTAKVYPMVRAQSSSRKLSWWTFELFSVGQMSGGWSGGCWGQHIW